MTFLPRLASLVFNQPHAITPEAAEAIVAALQGRLGEIDLDLAALGRQHEAQANAFVGRPVLGDDKRYRGYRLTERGAAIVPIQGELVNRGSWLGASSGLVSYEGLRHTLRAVAADPQARSIVLDIDSPGGQVTGMAETADLVRSIAEAKPVIAVANGLAASAAYGIASAASRIVVGRDAHVGSVGVVYMHADRSKQFDKAGIKVTLIHAGARKVDGNPFQPLPEDVRGDIQTRIDEAYGSFVALVCEGRPALSEDAIRTTEARVDAGRDAVDRGLADDVSTFDTALAEAEAGRTTTRSRRASRAPQQQETPMNTANGPGATAPGTGSLTLDQLNDAVASLRTTLGFEASAAADAAQPSTAQAVAAAPVEMKTSTDAAYKDGIAAERTRIKGILGLPEAKERRTAALALAIETDSTPEAARAVLAAIEPEGKSGAQSFYRAVAAAGGDPRVRHVGDASEQSGANAAAPAPVDAAQRYPTVARMRQRYANINSKTGAR